MYISVIGAFMLVISENEVVNRLKFDNPWWEKDPKLKIAFSDNPRRNYFQSFYKEVTNREINRAVVLMGPRRVGKTVMVMQSIHELIKNNICGKNILFISLETPIYTGFHLEKLLNLFIEHNGHNKESELFIYFDEIQYLKDWEVHLKSLVDSYPSYKFVVTGSAAAALRMKSNESGAGRFSDYLLPPLTFAEYLSFIKKDTILIQENIDSDISSLDIYKTTDINELNKEFINYLNYGGYPEAVFSSEIRDNQTQYIKNDIIDKVLLRDLPSLYGISDIQELNRLFTTLAYNTGQEVSLDALSKDSGVAKNTIKRYLEYLEAAFLIRRIERIDNNCKRFKRITSFKVYLTNPSMRAALFGQIDENSDQMGALTETAIFSQWQHTDSSFLYYSRWNKGEIDIVSLSPTQKPRWFIEVKWSDRHFTHTSELDNCIEFKKIHAAHLIDSNEILVTSKTIDSKLTYRNEVFRFTPASLYTYLLGKNILKSR